MDLSHIIGNVLSEQTIDRVAKDTKFMIRRGKIPPTCFVNTLLCNQSDQAHTSLPDIAADLNQAYNIDASKEAIHKKFTPEAVKFFEGILGELLSEQVQKIAGKGSSLHFPRIKIKDSTKFALPAIYGDDYKGYGNFSKSNGLMSLQYEYDLVSGNWLSLAMTRGLRNDQQDSLETTSSITEGDLHIRDLGYITPAYVCAIVDKQAFFLNRLPPQPLVFTPDGKPLDWEKIDRYFKNNALTCKDLDVLVYKKEKVPCRLIIEQISNSEYDKRLEKARIQAKSNNTVPTASHKIKLRYNLFITNVDADILPFDVIRKTYYLRWQIELVFKTWKSFFHIDQMKKVKKERLECQLLARLLWILINWRIFNTFNNHARQIDKDQGVSVLIFFKRCVKFAASLRLVLLKKFPIKTWLEQIYLPLIADCLCKPPKNKQTHYQSLKINIKP